MRINEEGLALVKQFEGCSLKAYRDLGGVLTVGFGHTGADVIPGMVIEGDEAELLLLKDLRTAETAVARCVSVPLNENQYSALCSMVFNIGAEAFRMSTLRAYVNRRAWLLAADEMLKWNHIGKKESGGLTARRQAERALFLKPVLVKGGA